MKKSDFYEKLSRERKSLQKKNEIPLFMETPGYSMFLKKYVEEGKSVKDRYTTIAVRLAEHANRMYGGLDAETGFKYWEADDNGDLVQKVLTDWDAIFFFLMWKGWLSPSTPVLANLGTSRGLPVSCEGSYIHDSIYGFYDSLKEAAVLSQNGFGTSAYLGDIRPRGSKFADNGQANGVVPVYEDFVTMANKVSQGSTRRGSWAGYLEVDHPDFDELIDSIQSEPSNKNIGWIFTDAFIERMMNGDVDALARYQKVMKLRLMFGKGYIWKVDAVNRQQTEPYKLNGLKNKASNLCSEIALFSDDRYSYTCVLSSLNLSKWDEWRDSDAIFFSTVFLDCVTENFLVNGDGIPGLEKAINYTRNARSLGLGVMGFHDLLQQYEFSFDSESAKVLNEDIFRSIQDKSYEASRWMAENCSEGEPLWCKGTGMRNTHTMAIAPTLSTALIVGGTSQGIEPFVANAWSQGSAAGESFRINPNLIPLMKAAGVYNHETIEDIVYHQGSVQHVEWLTDFQKEVFKTAYEIDQNVIVDLASDRQPFIDQGQSLNLFFPANPDMKYVSQVHKKALLDPNIKGLYYVRSQHGKVAQK